MTTGPIELIPAQPQALWGRLAVANFALGGLGAGLYLVAAGAARWGSSPAVAIASWLGPALVLAGFAAVAAEAGRPWRGPRVLARVGTSWMSRELWFGGAFVVLAGLGLVAPRPALRLLAAAAAVALALAQGLILRHARGVAAWDAPLMPPLFLASALLSGLGLHTLIEVAGGRTPARALLGATIGFLVVGLGVWLAYLTGSRDEAFRRATGPLRDGRLAIELAAGGYLLPLVLAGLALGLPAGGELAAALGAALIIAGQVRAKAALLLRAGRLRPVTIPHLRLGRPS